MQAIGGGIAAAREGIVFFRRRKSRESFARALRLAQDGKTHRIEIALNLVVPESDRPEPLRFEMPVPCGIAS
jgi:hypothetical protein